MDVFGVRSLQSAYVCFWGVQTNMKDTDIIQLSEEEQRRFKCLIDDKKKRLEKRMKL